MTFSIVARCARTGQFGMAISSSSPAVAARCAHVRAGVGAVASQNITDPGLGPLVLDRLEAGLSAEEALQAVTEGRSFIDYRQLLVVDGAGHTAIHSGSQVLGVWAEARATDCAAGGNLLAGELVPIAMVEAFAASKGHLGERLMQALETGLTAGGEAGPVHSAGLKVADRLSWPLVDLRIDWSDDPIGMLRTAWNVYAPQMTAYVQRAEDPTQAPSYGVPGDE
ncbi:DUF1028 domain-containing protein [Planktothrix agardhii 1811]|uniref:DUF1028 domain-containing protein n=1 Tax=Planktothrix agardhii TaxID=1160 RepID=UPI001F1F9153|nr:DUF1028 domain-containing protein [Planktothrix agardhii]MCF3581119.1 DUF1028 domain-containing protein [Planktothrix agardhii 1811]